MSRIVSEINPLQSKLISSYCSLFHINFPGNL